MQSFNDNFENGIHKMFDHIWDAKIEHPVFADTVGDLMEAVIQLYHNTVRRPDFMPTYEVERKYDATFVCKYCKYFIQNDVVQEPHCLLGDMSIEPYHVCSLWKRRKNG